MIKVLLIDDEKLALDYIEHIIDWEYYGLELIGVTTDTEQALNIYRKHKPDLIVTDVRMPGMDGLAFASLIRENDKRTHILFLSAFKEFSYLKQAIRLGIDDYIIKSDVDEEIFLQKVLGLKETIIKEKSKRQYTTSKILEELFHKNAEEEKYKNLLEENEYIKLFKRYYYLIISENTIMKIVSDLLNIKITEFGYSEYELEEICKTESAECGINLVSLFSIGNQEYLAVLELENTSILQLNIMEILYYFTRKVRNRINEQTEHEYNFFYYTKGCSVRQFSIIFRERKQQLLKKFVSENPLLMQFGEEINKDSENVNSYSFSVEEIYKAILNEKKEVLEKIMIGLQNAITQEDYVSYLWYVKNILEALQRFENNMQGGTSGRRFTLAESCNIFDLRKPIEVVNFLKYKLDEVKIISNKKEKSKYSAIINQALEFIEKNILNPELSSSIVAKKVNLSNSWLSTKFKEEVGSGISDYMNEMRIEQAKKLFDTQEYMIYEVAEKVGFTSSQYFSKIFKQYTGMTPNEYRRNNGAKNT